jgi:hypothetical protein
VTSRRSSGRQGKLMLMESGKQVGAEAAADEQSKTYIHQAESDCRGGGRKIGGPIDSVWAVGVERASSRRCPDGSSSLVFITIELTLADVAPVVSALVPLARESRANAERAIDELSAEATKAA